MASPTKFLVVDDHPLFLDALGHAIAGAYPAATVVEANSLSTARKTLQNEGPFDLVLLDLSMPDVRGFDGLIELRTSFPRQPIVIVSALEDPRIIHEVMEIGAAGFIAKSVRRPLLEKAISDVMAGLVTLPESYSPPPESRMPRDKELTQRVASLTPQQLRVLAMLRQGMLNKQIAFELDVGETTVKAHVSEVLRKLNVASRTQAVIEASKIDFDSVLADPADRGRATQK